MPINNNFQEFIPMWINLYWATFWINSWILIFIVWHWSALGIDPAFSVIGFVRPRSLFNYLFYTLDLLDLYAEWESLSPDGDKKSFICCDHITINFLRCHWHRWVMTDPLKNSRHIKIFYLYQLFYENCRQSPIRMCQN